MPSGFVSIIPVYYKDVVLCKIRIGKNYKSILSQLITIFGHSKVDWYSLFRGFRTWNTTHILDHGKIYLVLNRDHRQFVEETLKILGDYDEVYDNETDESIWFTVTSLRQEVIIACIKIV